MCDRSVIIAILLPFLLVTGLAPETDGETVPFQRVEDFSSFKDGSFPEGWKSRGGEGSAVYVVRSNQEAYLEANAENSAVAIAKEFAYELSEYPYLKWQWRVFKLPKGGDERFKETNDSAAAIYVIFEGFLRPNTIKYVWSASLPLATTTESPHDSKTKIVVLRNQHSPLEEWVPETVNVHDDYRRLFKGEPKQVQAIGLMSDSDNTRSKAIAHYKGITVSMHK
ncbi:MAG: hypothetical protein DRG87_03095 [Deltaproteobacteria bacterium]|nr:MAG: hypothetical protein DRG87_03095 [Deltaproteobacteria bacterium]